MELCLQLAIIFVGKQFLMSVVEYHLPRLWKLLNTLKVMAGVKKVDKNVYPQWIKDYQLVEWGKQGLFYEYLEMGEINKTINDEIFFFLNLVVSK